MLWMILALLAVLITVLICVGAKIRKGWKAAFLTASLVFLVFALVIMIQPVYIPDAASLEEEAYAQKLAQGYLSYQKFDLLGGLSDFRVQRASKQSDGIISADYDVCPYPAAYFEWNAGNGKEGEDGWLIDKFGYFKVSNLGDFYFVSFLGTGL